MSTYAIGDIHGCRSTLDRLLRRVEFNPARDRLRLAGDLVNRGPHSLDVLRWAMQQGDRVEMVLGNQDLHLVAVALGVGLSKPRDTLAQVLAAPDLDDIVEWLRTRPLFRRAGAVAFVHAGLWPEWSLEDAAAEAAEAERALRGPLAGALLRGGLYARELPRWTDHVSPLVRRQLALAAFTRLRLVAPDGRADFGFKGAPEAAPDGLVPWYDAPRRARQGPVVLFGHWAAAGFRMVRAGVCLDSACYRHGALTALRLEDGAVFHEPSVM